MSEPDTDSTGSALAGNEVGRWLSAIDAAIRDADPYMQQCKIIRDRYRYERSKTTRRRQYQMLWSNIEVLKPVTYGRAPKPVVQSRFKDGDPVARIASTLLERNIAFSFDQDAFDHAFRLVRDSYLLYGRGVPRLRYEPVFEEASIDDGLSEEDGEPDEPNPNGEILKMENVCLDFINPSDFIHPAVRSWPELPWVAYRSFLSRNELIRRFGEDVGRKIRLDARPGDTTDNSGRERTDSASDKATIFEIWDKANGVVLWVARGYAEVLDEGEPYLKLDGFFPSPRPAYGTLTDNTLIPVPDYVYYQDQAEEIDELTARIASLQDALKLVGFYKAGPQGEGSPEVEKAARAGFENKMVAVKSWDSLKSGGTGGLDVVWWPADMVAKVIVECITVRKQLIDDVYQITGISDIMRGDTEASETATAQQLKTQTGTMRTRERQNEMARVCRDVCRMAGEIMADKFEVSTLMQVANIRLPTNAEVQEQAQQAYMQWQIANATAQQSGSAPPPSPPPPEEMGPTVEQVEALLRDGVTRRFRLDIETDSTVAMDEQAEQASRTDFIAATTQFISAWGPILQVQPNLGPLAGQLLMFGVNAYPKARELAETIQKTVEQMEAQLAQPKPPPQPSPDELVKAEVAKTKGQVEIQKAQIEGQTAQAQSQADLAKAAMDSEHAAAEHGMKMEHLHATHAVKMTEAQMAAQQARERSNGTGSTD